MAFSHRGSCSLEFAVVLVAVVVILHGCLVADDAPSQIRIPAWWLFRRLRSCCRTHHSATVSSTHAFLSSQAAQILPPSSLLNLLRHRFGSEPPPGSEDDEQLHDGDYYYDIFCSPTKLLRDVVFNLDKPTHREAPSQPWLHASSTPLQPFAGELFSGGGFGFGSFMDLDVIGSFLKGLVVFLLL